MPYPLPFFLPFYVSKGRGKGFKPSALNVCPTRKNRIKININKFLMPFLKFFYPLPPQKKMDTFVKTTSTFIKEGFKHV